MYEKVTLIDEKKVKKELWITYYFAKLETAFIFILIKFLQKMFFTVLPIDIFILTLFIK